jgi:hypothetical protein
VLNLRAEADVRNKISKLLGRSHTARKEVQLSKYRRLRVLVLGLLVTAVLCAQNTPSANQVSSPANSNPAETFRIPNIVQGMSADDLSFAKAIRQAIVSHRSSKRGDMADAFQIQMQLAQYWSAHHKTDDERLCMERAQAALRAQQSGGVAAYPKSAAASTPVVTAAASAPQGSTFSANRLYYAMINGALEKWDFNADGSFLHQGVVAGSGTSVRGSERGTYQIQGNVLQLQITKQTTAFLTPGVSSSGRNTQMGGNTTGNAQTRKMTFQSVGSDGQNGVVLNGTTFKVRHWE